jgi:ribonuclease VapC
MMAVHTSALMAVDTSALMAVILNEPPAEACIGALERAPGLVISALTLAEALVVATRRGVSAEMQELMDHLGFEVVPVSAAVARRIGDVYRRWGRGRHAASLNFGDCFSYDTAKTRACPLLFVGDDFSKTDLESVL